MEISMANIIQGLINYALLFSVHLIIILLLRKKVCQWFGAVTAYKLWFLPLACLPFYLVDWSFLNSLALNDYYTATGVLGPAAELVVKGVDVGRLSYESSPQNDASTLWSLAFMIWLTGVLVLTGIFGYKNWKFSEFIQGQTTLLKSDRLQKLIQSYSFPARMSIILISGIGSPALYGPMHPKLLIPCDFLESVDEDQRHIMLAHESIHYQRRDNMWSTAASIIGIIFWFNPLVYFAYPLFRVDQELSCDSLTLLRCNSVQRRLYPKTLVDSANKLNASNGRTVVSNWNNLKDLKERTVMLNEHLNHKNGSRNSKFALLTVLLCGSLFSFVFAGNASGFIQAEIVPEKYLIFFTEDTQNRLIARDNPRNPIPTNSDHLVFIVDSSGSMFNYAWKRAIDEIGLVLSQYSNVQAFQIINDMGQYLVPEKRREWIEATDTEIESALDKLKDFNAFSNSSPIEGINEALEYLIKPSMSASIFVLGDELSSATSPEEMISLIGSKASGVRVHTKMFPVYFSQPEPYRIVAKNFAETMLEIAELTDASFELVE